MNRFLLATLIVLGFFSCKIYGQNRVDIQGQIDSLNQRSKDFCKINFDSAGFYAREALKLSEEMDYPVGEISALINLAEAFLYFGSLDSSMFYFNWAGKFSSNRKNFEKFSFTALQGMGRAHYNKSEYAEAIHYYDKAMAELPQSIKEDYLASALNNKGRAYKRSGELEKAQQSFIEALRYADLNDDNTMRAIILTNLGIINRNLNQPENALSYYDQALKYLEILKDSDGIGKIYQNKANLYSDKQDHKNSLKYNFLAKEIIEKTNYKSINYATLLNNIGLSYCYLNELDSALIYFDQALDLSIDIEDTYGIADTKINLGMVHLEKNNSNKAGAFIKEGIATAKEIGAIDVMIGGYHTLIEYHSLVDDYKEALHVASIFAELKDSLYNVESVTAINELQEKYETEKKEKEIAVQKVEIEKKHALNKLYVALLLTIGLALIASLYLYRKKRRALIKLVEKNKELAQKHKSNPTNTNNNNITEKQRQLYNDFIDRLENDEIYRDNNLNLEMLAKTLQTNRTEISGVINKMFDTNYATLINGYRIKHAIRLLSDPAACRQYSIEGISLESGFKSPSLFFKLFKEQTGLTPKNFAKNN